MKLLCLLVLVILSSIHAENTLIVHRKDMKHLVFESGALTSVVPFEPELQCVQGCDLSTITRMDCSFGGEFLASSFQWYCEPNVKVDGVHIKHTITCKNYSTDYIWKGSCVLQYEAVQLRPANWLDKLCLALFIIVLLILFSYNPTIVSLIVLSCSLFLVYL